MPTARVQRPLPSVAMLIAGAADIASALRRAPRAGVEELDEARELLTYWEGRLRRLPRWAVMRRREARAMAARWRLRVREVERTRYGSGLLGTASQLAIERRMPTAVAHRTRQAARVAVYTGVTVAITVLVLLAAALAVVGEVVLGAL